MGGENEEERRARIQGDLALQQQASQQAIEERTKQARALREEELARGRARGEELFGQGALGRLTEGRAAEVQDLVSARQQQAAAAGQRSADIADVIERRRAGLEGLSAEENQALRAQALQQIGQGEQRALRQLRGFQAGAGVAGGLAGAQAGQVLQEAQRARTQAEQDLFLRNIAERQRALGAFEQSVTGAETGEFGRQQQAQAGLEALTQQSRADELARQQFNLQQAARERFGRLGTELGFGQLGLQEQAAIGQQVAAEQAALQQQLAAEEGGGGFNPLKLTPFGKGK